MARANDKSSPYDATIIPLPSSEFFTSALRLEVNVNHVHAMCTTVGLLNAFKCHPFFDIQSPTSYTRADTSQEPKGTTGVGGKRIKDVQLGNGGGDHVGDVAHTGDDVTG